MMNSGRYDSYNILNNLKHNIKKKTFELIELHYYLFCTND